jgi:hypothetical protein
MYIYSKWMWEDKEGLTEKNTKGDILSALNILNDKMFYSINNTYCPCSAASDSITNFFFRIINLFTSLLSKLQIIHTIKKEERIILTVEEITLAWTVSTHWNKYKQIVSNVPYYFANENSKGHWYQTIKIIQFPRSN